MPKCDFNVALQGFEIALWYGCSPVNQNTFIKNTSGWLLLKNIKDSCIFFYQPWIFCY